MAGIKEREASFLSCLLSSSITPAFCKNNLPNFRLVEISVVPPTAVSTTGTNRVLLTACCNCPRIPGTYDLIHVHACSLSAAAWFCLLQRCRRLRLLRRSILFLLYTVRVPIYVPVVQIMVGGPQVHNTALASPISRRPRCSVVAVTCGQGTPYQEPAQNPPAVAVDNNLVQQ